MRSRPFALGGLAVGAVLALVAASRAWWRAAGTGVSVAFPGTEATGGLAQALALVVLAGALLGLALRSRGRRVLGVLLALAGAGVVVLGVLRPRPSAGTVQSRVLEVSLADQFALVGTAWPYVYAAAGAVVLAAAVLMTLTAARWPTRAARFERSAGAAAALNPDDPATLWRSLDAGLDPTDEGTPAGSTGEAGERSAEGSPEGSSDGAGVREPSTGVTMRSRTEPRTAPGADEPT